jgi:preprotein translocase subunit SecB
MVTQDQKLLKFHGVDIVKVEFVSEDEFVAGKCAIDLNIDAKVYYPKERPNHFNIMMNVTVESENVFLLNIYSIASFEFAKNIDEEIKKNFINVNAPAIVFPYLRSFITSFTSNLGSTIPPITIPIRFFKGKMEEISSDTTEQIKEAF